MKQRDPNEALLAIGISLAILAVLIYKAITGIDPGALLALAERLAPLALGAAAIASALATQRLFATERTLASRRALAVLAAEEFDAGPEAVLAFAAQLARTDRGLRGVFDRRATALRIKLCADRRGRLVYLLEAPERSMEQLRTALRTYRGIELREPSAVLGKPQAAPQKAKAVRAELVLRHPSVRPLARPGADPDPLQPFAAVLAGLDAERGERAEVCIDLLPAEGWRHERLRRALARQARRAQRRHYGGGPGLLERLSSPEQHRRLDPLQQQERREAAKALQEKLRDSGALFEAQILLRCKAPERGRAKVAMKGLLGAFATLAAENRLRVAGWPLAGLEFLGSDIPGRRRRFDRRFASGLHRPARRTILTARELAGFLRPPTVSFHLENVVRSGPLLYPPPPTLPEFVPGERSSRALIPLGRLAGESGERIVGVSLAETFFTYIAGRSRYGKTETAVAQFAHLVRGGAGGLFLDPHGDALTRLRPYLAGPGVAERVVEIDLGPGAQGTQPGWNLFELGGAEGTQAVGSVDTLVDAFASAQEWGERSTRAINLTTQAAIALAYLARALPAELAPTIFQLPTLLSNARWRRAALPFLPAAARAFWTERFPLLSPEAITPLTNLVDRLRAFDPTAALLGQSRSTYRVREAMDKGLIVLVCPGMGGAHERLIANLFLFDLLHSARRRAELAPSERRPFWVFLDEVQTYDGAASGNLAALLEQSAKFGLRAVLLNQNPERLRPRTVSALATNRSHMLATALDHPGAARIAREWGRGMSAEALSGMERFRFVAQVTHEGELSKPFALSGITLEDVLGPSMAATDPVGLGEGAAARQEASEALAHLETLDERIYAVLGERLGKAAGPAQGQGLGTTRIETQR